MARDENQAHNSARFRVVAENGIFRGRVHARGLMYLLFGRLDGFEDIQEARRKSRRILHLLHSGDV